jgi:hypothetical protein
MKILLADFNAKVGMENNFKPTNGNKSSHQISKDNGVRVVNFASSKNLDVRSSMFPHCNIQITPGPIMMDRHNQIHQILIDMRQLSSIPDVESFRGANCDTDHYLVVFRFNL